MSNTITVSGQTFSFTPRFSEGHTLTANEAEVLNRTLAENVGNNFRAKVKEATEANAFDQEKFQAEFDGYVSSYEFGVRRAGSPRTPVDPLQAEIRRLATEKVRAAIKAAGLTNVSKDAVNAKVDSVLANEDHLAKLTSAAKANLKAMEKIAADSEADLVSGLESGPKRQSRKAAEPAQAAA